MTRNSLAQAGALVILLPESATTKSGVQFSPRENPWHFQDGTTAVHIDFDRIPSGCCTLEQSLRWTLVSVFRSLAPMTVQNLFDTFVHFGSKLAGAGIACSSIGVREIQAYRAALLPHEQWRVATFNALIQRWFLLNHPGVDEEGVQYLREARKGGNSKGDAVRTHDPEKGPFTEKEYTLLYRALDQAYGAGALEGWAFVLGRLLFATGARISQYASMKLCDLKVSADSDGRTFTVDVPLVKQGEEHSRKRLKPYALSPQTGQLLFDYINGAKARGAATDAPLFPSKREGAGNGVFKGHCAGVELSRRFVQAVSPHAPVTHRLNGAALPVTPRRFRYTLGTRLAEEGCSKAVIADRLGQSDLQNVDVYYEASPKIVENIDAALFEPLAPIAQAFHGRLIEGDSQATRAGAPGASIRDLRVSVDVIASCATDGECGFLKPVACYTCFKFEPWLDGPHEKVLARLLQEREKHQADPRVAAVNDDTILAVREVIAECAAVKAQRRGEASHG